MTSEGVRPLASAEVFVPAREAFIAVGAMVEAAGQRTGSLLANGLVLIAGGLGETGAIRGAELFDPSTGSFRPTGSLGVARWGHTATVLGDGTVLLAGGSGNDGALDSAELYVPATEQFMPVGKMVSQRQGHAAQLLGDGKVLLTGGIGPNGDTFGPLATAELYDPATKTFSPAATMMSVPRQGHTMTLLPTGAVLIAGGDARPGAGASSTAELFVPGTGIFQSTATMETARAFHAAALLSEGAVLITGGSGEAGPVSAAEIYHP
jgi:hypothetical protein